MRPAHRVLSPAEQAETDRVAETVLAHLRRILRHGTGSRAAHEVWVQQQQLGPGHSEACDCAACVPDVNRSGPKGGPP